MAAPRWARRPSRSGAGHWRPLPVKLDALSLEGSTNTIEHAATAPYGRRVEYAALRRVRERNTLTYRAAHYPVWSWVFFIAPGPLTADLFHHGFSRPIAIWLAAVLAAVAVAGILGRLPGCERAPYVMFFTEDKPNPGYRRVCYTVAWSEIIAFAAVNLAGLVVAVITGHWRMREIYAYGYLPVAALIGLLGVAGVLPRAKRSVKYEGYERRLFYGAVWAVALAHPLVWLLWATLPPGPASDVAKLAVFVTTLAVVGWLSWKGHLPRTRPIVPGEPLTLD
jgi:hypothetical protein